MSDTSQFYQRLPVVHRFRDVADLQAYREAPDDWMIAVADVKGSTQAIEEGRYRDVNVVGGASIVAVLNATKGIEIPYVFGGDGATFLFPNFYVPQVRAALEAAQIMSRDHFQLNLRVGFVPLAALYARGQRVLVARYAISETNQIAMIAGGGLTLAEELIKNSEDKRFLIPCPEAGATSQNCFEGLHCRWNPILARGGEILTLLVLAKGATAQASQTYLSIIQHIESVLGEHARTLESAQMNPTWLPKAPAELKVYGGKEALKRWRRRLVIYFEMTVLVLSHLIQKPIFGFNAARYLSELADNTDFRKFDDVLRMVLDCSPANRSLIVNYLAKLQEEGKIAYGSHISDHALLTCMVFSSSNHLHFIDGGGGGYSLAAKQLKEQLK